MDIATDTLRRRGWIATLWSPGAIAVGLMTILVLGAGAASAATPEEKCADAVAVQGRNFFKNHYKTISKCEENKAKGTLLPSVNCRPADGPVTDPTTDDKLTDARAKLDDKLTGKCTAVTIANVTVGEPCDQETLLADLLDCVADDAYGAIADNLIDTVFDATPELSTGEELNCQKTISKEAEKLARTHMTQRRACAKKLLSGKLDICPDTKATAKLDQALGKLQSKIGGKCSAAQLAGDIDFGFPCDSYELTVFDRDGVTNNNLIPLDQRMVRCISAVAAGTGGTGADVGYPLPETSPFSFGVAAGDATDSAFIAWTRTDGAGTVTLEVATDAAFTSIVHTDGSLTPDPAADNAVKTDVTGLSAATQYYYRFTQGGDTSRTGRIRTAPASGGPITFAFTGDSNAFFKPYPVLEQITNADPDLWLYIGDTIYGDDTRSGTGVATVRADYHVKYKENRNDRALRDLMANVGTVTIWDDHEVTNDFAGKDPGVGAQMAEGNQAFRDYMPIREDGGDAEQLYRSFQWGDVAEFFLLDVRQYRDLQADVTEIECNEGECDTTADPCSIDSDCDPFMLGQTCINVEPVLLPTDAACLAEIADPSREYLGATQLQWLKDGLDNSTATFKFVMNGPLISALDFLPYDRWEGYSSERQDLLDHVTNQGINNVIFLSTDIHAAIINDSVEGTTVRELVAGAIGMDPIFRELPPTVEAIVGLLPSLFSSISYYDIDRFNIATVRVTSSDVTFEYRDGSGQVLKTEVIAAVP
jgi:phosphodiesterase/alkaline phosphatase D-like protein